VLINDAYNANPLSMTEAIKAFCTAYAIKRKIVVLGTMKELGPIAEEEHYKLGKFLASEPIEQIYWIGDFGEDIQRGVSENPAAKEKMHLFDSPGALAEALVKELKDPCAIFFKASRSNEFEKIVQAVSDRYAAHHKGLE
jgi:UDP-N-acetylmuramoyl-tripeptide--D-alanyl-D-alanine ligase